MQRDMIKSNVHSMPHRNLIEISATISRTMPVSSYVGNYEELEYLFNRCRCGGALSITPHIIINVGYHNVARAIRTCSLLHFTNYIVYLFVYDMHSQPARRIIKKKEIIEGLCGSSHVSTPNSWHIHPILLSAVLPFLNEHVDKQK